MPTSPSWWASVAHALYKGPLFMVAGNVDHATHTRDIRKLAGLWRQLPWTATTAILAGLSMAGLPPLFGFLAKETLLETLFTQLETTHDDLWWIAIGLAGVVGAFFVAYSFTLLWETFLRRTSPEPTADGGPPVRLCLGCPGPLFGVVGHGHALWSGHLCAYAPEFTRVSGGGQSGAG